jgi:hypothetical protein
MNKIKSFKTSFKKMDETVNAWLATNPTIEVKNINYFPLFHETDEEYLVDHLIVIHYDDNSNTLKI